MKKVCERKYIYKSLKEKEKERERGKKNDIVWGMGR